MNKTKSLYVGLACLFASFVFAEIIFPPTGGSGGGGGGGDVTAAGNNVLTGSNTFEGKVEFKSTVLATNGNIELLNDGFNMTLGVNGGVSSILSWVPITQRAGFDFDVAGTGINLYSNTLLRVRENSQITVDSGAVVDIDSVPTNSFLWVGSGGTLSTGKFGAGLSLAADGTLSATGSGSPGGSDDQVQFNEGGAFDGTNELVFTRASKLLSVGPVSTFGAGGFRTFNTTTTNKYIPEGVYSHGSFQRFYLNQPGGGYFELSESGGVFSLGGSAVGGIQAGTATIPLGGANFSQSVVAQTSVITPRLQVGSVSNLTMTVGDNLHVNGTNRTWGYTASTNASLVFTNLQLNTPVELTVFPSSASAGWALTFDGLQPQSWGSNGVPVIATNGGPTIISVVRVSSTETNAYIVDSPLFKLLAGENIVFSTNFANLTITASLKSSPTNIAGITYSMNTPGITVSNLTVNFGSTNVYFLAGLTNAVLTNMVELPTGQSGRAVIHAKNTTGVAMGIVWPAHGAAHGYYFRTNSLNDPKATTSIPAGEYWVFSGDMTESNTFWTATKWE